MSSTNQKDSIEMNSTNQEDSIQSNATNQKDSIELNSTSQKDSIQSNATNQTDGTDTYQCGVCGKAGMTSYHLYQHRKGHKNLTPMNQKGHHENSTLNQYRDHEESTLHQQWDHKESALNQQRDHEESTLHQQRDHEESTLHQQRDHEESALNQQRDHEESALNQQRDEDDLSLYQCDKCAMGFTSFETLTAHCSTHRDEETLTCKLCRKRFQSEDSMKIHRCVNIVHDGYQCSVCGEVFPNIDTLKGHFLFEHRDSEGIGKVEDVKPIACEVLLGRAEFSDHMKNHDSEGELQCRTCGKVFQKRRNLYRHSKTHVNDGNHNCSFCKRSFVREVELNKHEQTHEWIREEIGKFLAPSGLDCSVCDLTFTGTEEFQDHYSQHIINDDTHRCLMCITQFDGEDRVQTLLSHMVTRHGKKTPFQCQVCGKFCLDNAQLVRHSQCHNPLKHLTCSVCHMVFNRRYRLNIHMNKHTGDQPYQCSECHLSFQSPRNLAKHKRCHAGKNFNCDICHQVLNDKCAMLDHTARVHTGPDLMNCPECGIPFSSKMYLSVHMRNVHGFTEKDKPTPYQCSVCQKYCKTASSLITHSKTHGPAKHTCEICNRGFISANNLQQHFRVHLSSSGKVTSENYRKCKFCDKEFDSRKQCAKHMVTHTKEKPHVCEVCGRQYSLKASLAKHMVSSHMSEEDINAVLNCDICGKRCFSADSLDQHMSTHTVTENNICVECGDSFSSSKGLKEHKRQMHSSHTTHGRRQTEGKLREGLVRIGVSKRGHEADRKGTCQIPRLKFPRYSTSMMNSSTNFSQQKEGNFSSETEMRDKSIDHADKGDGIQETRSLGMNQNVQMKSTNFKTSAHASDSKVSIPLCHDEHPDTGQESEFPQGQRGVCWSSVNVCDESVRIVKHRHISNGGRDGERTKSQTPCSQDGDGAKSQTCSQCNRSAPSQLDQTRHMSKDHGRRRGQDLPRCSLCGVCFIDNDCLQAHVKVHTAYVPVKKEKSERGCLSLATLDGKAYKCSVCDQMFAKSSLLESHVKVHSQDLDTLTMWRFHLVNCPKSQSYVCVHLSQESMSCDRSYDSL